MLQRLMIEVEASQPLVNYGSNHVLIFDGTTKTYFPMTREEFLAPQNAKIKQLSDELEKFEKRLEESLLLFEHEITKELEKFETDSTNEYANFLKTYKETNSKMIEMIKSVVVPQGV